MPAEFWKSRPVFVTGSDGIVGSWIIKDLLARKSKVVALVRDHNPRSELFLSQDIKRITVIDGRLQDLPLLSSTLKRYKIDTVFHLGAQAIVGEALRKPLETFESNIRGTAHVLEACRGQKSVQRIVVASSDKAYGAHKDLPYTENMPLQGKFPYEVSKSCADLLAQSYAHSYALPVAIVRCGNIFGGGDLNASRIVPATIASLLKGTPPLIRSDGKYVRDYIYVKDVCAAYLQVAESLVSKKLSGEAFNCSNEQPLSVLALVKHIAHAMGVRVLKPKILNQAKGEIRAQFLSAAKIRRVLKWRPQYTLAQGLIETIAWYRAHS